ncbi:MAG: hypothetical protein WCJ81_09545 [bacterium]
MFTASPAYGISSLLISHWNEVYGRGNHALMGYLTGESDPIWTLEKSHYYTMEEINAKGYLT